MFSRGWPVSWLNQITTGHQQSQRKLAVNVECQEETGANMAKKVMGRLGDMAGRPVEPVEPADLAERSESDSKLCTIFRYFQSTVRTVLKQLQPVFVFSLGKCIAGIAILGSLRWVKKSC